MLETLESCQEDIYVSFLLWLIHLIVCMSGYPWKRCHLFLFFWFAASKASMKIDGVKGFTFKEMALATDNFNSSTQVGRGGYGKVYRGILSDNSIVAIKRSEEGSLQGQKEFLTEIKLLSRLHHRNLVSLVGYCDEEEQVIIMVLTLNLILDHSGLQLCKCFCDLFSSKIKQKALFVVLF